MPDAANLAKAELWELDAQFDQVINKDKGTKVQFNPDSLKVSLANQIAAPPGPGGRPLPRAGGGRPGRGPHAHRERGARQASRGRRRRGPAGEDRR